VRLSINQFHLPGKLAQFRFWKFSLGSFRKMRSMTVVVKGLGGAFLKSLSICSRKCVASYLEFEMIRVSRNGDLWAQTPISAHCGALPVLWDRVYRKGLLRPHL
jgi:hypothetical protein